MPILETFANFEAFPLKTPQSMAARFDEIGALFLKRRKELGLTQRELGERVGVSKTEISKIAIGRGITFAKIEKLSKALDVRAEIELRPATAVDGDVVHYIVMSLGLFARRHGLTKREACNYLSRYRGLEFAIANYEAEHQLSLDECVDDMAAICHRNGGLVI